MVAVKSKHRSVIRHLKRYLAIRSYMLRLSRELVRRFGRQPFYSIEEVTQAVQRGGLSTPRPSSSDLFEAIIGSRAIRNLRRTQMRVLVELEDIGDENCFSRQRLHNLQRRVNFLRAVVDVR